MQANKGFYRFQLTPGVAVVSLCLLLVSGYVFAIDGVFSIGDKSRKAQTFSTIKKDMKLSLSTGAFSYQSARPSQSLTGSTVTGNNKNTVIYQRGNVTIHIPVKTKSTLLQTFKTPSAPTIR